MRNVLSTLLIAVALSTGAHALWACGEIDGQAMTPAQAQTYKQAITDAVLAGQTPPTASDVLGVNVLNGPSPNLPSFNVTGESSSSTSVVKHDPTADIVVPQIDLVKDLAGDMLPDGNCTPQVM
jgi:hypothetical protein